MTRPTVFVGECTGRLWREWLRPLGWGRLWIARDRRIYVDDGEPWAVDNGAFRDWKKGTPFDHAQYRRVIYGKAGFGTFPSPFPPPKFIVAPDVPAGGLDSLRLSVSQCSKTGYLPLTVPRYLVVQDGMRPDDVRPHLVEDASEWTGTIRRRTFDGLFLGGTDRFKGTADTWLELAREVDVPFHYGRCGTIRKLTRALELGVDSLDSAFPLWNRQRLKDFIDLWKAGGTGQGVLF